MNDMILEIPARSENESFVRVVVAAFAARLDPTLEELNELKTAVSEVVTNCVLHAYEGKEGRIMIKAAIDGNKLMVEVQDAGKGIKDIAVAREPLYTEKPELERAGMGFTIIENFMDEVLISSKPNEGTIVKMVKYFNENPKGSTH
jgi:stage II sporulation protein AB (anti-sigma F factor)